MDPWQWSVEDVVNNLCHSRQLWADRPNTHLPLPPALEAAIRENELNGSSLLSDVSLETLKTDFEIKPLSHRSALVYAIDRLRNDSPGYKAHRVTITARDKHITDIATGANSLVHTVTPPQVHLQHLTAPTQHGSREPDSSTTQGQLSAETSHFQTLSLSESPSTQAKSGKILAEPSKAGAKKRKVLLEPLQPLRSARPASQSSSAYLGRGKLTASDVIYGSAEIGTAPHPEIASDDDSDLDILGAAKHITPGRRAYVSRRIHHLLRAEPEVLASGQMRLLPYPQRLEKGRLPALLARMATHGKAAVTKQDALFADYAGDGSGDDHLMQHFADNTDWDYLLQGYPADANDRVISSGDEEESAGDADAAQLAEEAASKLKTSKYLTADAVQNVMQEATEAFENDWADRKLAALESRARAIWQQGKRSPLNMETFQRELEHKQAYLNEQKQRVLANQWLKQAPVKKQCEAMKVTVHNIAELRWKIRLLQRRDPPSPKARVAKTQRKREADRESNDDDEDEIDLSSESDSFIEHDESPPVRTKLTYRYGQVIKSRNSPPDVAHDEPMQDIDAVMDADSPPPVKLELSNRLDSPARSKDSVLDSSGDDNVSIPAETKEILHPEDDDIIDLTQLESSPPPQAGSTIQTLESMITPVQKSSTSSPTPTAMSATQFQQATWAKDPVLATREEIDEWDIEDLEQRTDRKRLMLKLLIQMELELFVPLKAYFAKYRKFRGRIQRFELARALGELNAQSGSLTGVSDHEYVGLMAIARLFVCWIDSNSAHMNLALRDWKAIKKAQNNIQNNINQFRDFITMALGEDGAAARESDVEDARMEAEGTPRKRKKKRRILRSGQDLRQSALQRRVAGEQGAHKIKLQLESSGLKEDVEGIVINAAKEEGQEFIFVDKAISSRMKPHQVEGVRFLWREVVVAGHDGPSGCLLAHTMGLGKTMQSITFILTLIDAISKRSIADQIPAQLRPGDDLKIPRILVLCPPGLISNWIDELITWIPRSHILSDHFNSLTSALELSGRFFQINLWYDNGGILVIGYEMLRDLLRGRAMTEKMRTSLTNPSYEVTLERLSKGAHLVIADEAHKFKDANSAIAQAMAKLDAHARIALTGSPLANNLGEYYAMINWVAPSYLGDPSEFRTHFQKPIEEGTYADSTRYEQRRSMKKLQAFKEEVEPKVNRKDITALRHDLKPKTEFVLRFELNKLQFDAYTTFVRSLQANPNGAINNTRIFDWMNVLTLLLYHPAVFLAKLIKRDKERGGNMSKDLPVKAKSPNSEDVNDVDVDASKLDLSQSMLEQQQQIFSHLGPGFAYDALLSPKTRFIERILIAAKNTNEQVLIFSHSRPVLNHLESWLSGAHTEFRLSRLDGTTPSNDRVKLAKAFNAGRFDVMLISTRAGGLGLNLPGASRVILADFSFNPSWEEQAVGRAYRLGQEKPVFVYHLLYGGTFEEPLHQRTVFKKQLSHRAVDKKNSKPIANKMRDFLYEPVAQEQMELQPFKGPDVILDRVIDGSEDPRIRSITTMDIFNQADEELDAQELDEVRKELQAWRGRAMTGPSSAPGGNLPGLATSTPNSSAVFTGVNIGNTGPSASQGFGVIHQNLSPSMMDSSAQAPTPQQNTISPPLPVAPATGPAQAGQDVVQPEQYSPSVHTPVNR